MDHQIIDDLFPSKAEIMKFIQRLDKKMAKENKQTGQCHSNIANTYQEQNPLRKEHCVRKQYDVITIQQDSNLHSKPLENDQKTSSREQVNMQNSSNTNKSVNFQAEKCVLKTQ